MYSSKQTFRLVRSAFPVFYILLLLCILLIFESLILELQLKILIYRLKKVIVIHTGTICNLVLYFTNLQMCHPTSKIFKN